MWKRFKELVELLVNLQKLAPLLLGTLVIVVSIVAGLAGIGRLSVQINLPLPVIIAVSALALYPVAKFVQWWFRPLKPFGYSGLLWRPSHLSFGFPIPLCPHENCGCEVFCEGKPPPALQFIGVGTSNRIVTEETFIYECPIHGRVGGIPNEDVAVLQRKAKLLQSRPKQK
jgi:hypothetical protein